MTGDSYDHEAVVIGAGGLGTSTAFYLAAAGVDVALVDRYGVGQQTSARAAGMLVQALHNDLMTRIARNSHDLLMELVAEPDAGLRLHETGCIRATRSSAQAAEITAEVERANAAGFETYEVSRQEAQELAPYFNPVHAIALNYTPSDLYFRPPDLPRSYARMAERRGATVLSGTEVLGVAFESNLAKRVVTDQGDLLTPVVVDCAGAWAGAITRMIGYRLPTFPIRHQLFVTESLPSVRDEQPGVRVTDAQVYVRPDEGGLLFGAYEKDPQAWEDTDQLEDIANLGLDSRPLEGAITTVSEEFPEVGSAKWRELRGGLPTLTSDGYFVIDEVPGMAGFFVVSGDNVGGLSISPWIGASVAKWVTQGKKPEDVQAFSLSRFEGMDFDALAAASYLTYAHHT